MTIVCFEIDRRVFPDIQNVRAAKCLQVRHACLPLSKKIRQAKPKVLAGADLELDHDNVGAQVLRVIFDDRRCTKSRGSVS